MQKKIHKILNELGIPFSISGREILASAIELVYEKGRMSATTELYPTLGILFNISPSKIERRIRHAVERCFDSPNSESVKRIFGNTLSLKTGKLVNTEFIYGIVEYLKLYA